jgi:hypothetical protein
MRTTLDLEPEVLEIAKSLAKHQCRSLGKVVSTLIRRGLENPASEVKTRNGLRIISRPAHAQIVTLENVNQLRDE